jgi:LmbE family N-acetylglucosaminyl deacetylase
MDQTSFIDCGDMHMTTKSKDLVFFVAHIDDFEFSCMAFLFKKHNQYDNIKIVIPTTWEHKSDVWQKNLSCIEEHIGRKIEYLNLGYEQRTLNDNFDSVKSDFYKLIDFNNHIDILTHDNTDLHSDHQVLHSITKGLIKYVDQFICVYSPSSYQFSPNYYIELTEEQYELKYKLLTMYNFSKEQSFSKRGTYFRKNYVNIASVYAMENFVNRDMEYVEIYKIFKWIEK